VLGQFNEPVLNLEHFNPYLKDVSKLFHYQLILTTFMNASQERRSNFLRKLIDYMKNVLKKALFRGEATSIS